MDSLTQRAYNAVRELTNHKTTTGDIKQKALLDNPGVRATLRRCLSMPLDSPVVLPALRYLEPFLPPEDNEDEEHAFVTVAAMMCSQSPRARDDDMTSNLRTQPANVGASLAYAVEKHNVLSDKAAEQRLILLARQNTAGIHRLLPRTLLHVRQRQVPVNWAGLIEDLATWRQRHRYTTRGWLRDYHRTLNRLHADKQTNKTQSTTSESEAA